MGLDKPVFISALNDNFNNFFPRSSKLEHHAVRRQAFGERWKVIFELRASGFELKMSELGFAGLKDEQDLKNLYCRS
jgi:hypothetical protein